MAYLYHPIANCFPLIEGEEFNHLVMDIKKNGQHYPITLYENMILDGRNRYRACLENKIEPKYEHFPGGDPVDFVLSRNDIRRHLSVTERATAAAKLETLGWGRPKLTKPNENKGAKRHLKRTDLAKKFRVSPRAVARAKRVQSKGIEPLKDALANKQIPLNKAADIAKLPEPEQKAKLDIHLAPKAGVHVFRFKEHLDIIQGPIMSFLQKGVVVDRLNDLEKIINELSMDELKLVDEIKFSLGNLAKRALEWQKRLETGK